MKVFLFCKMKHKNKKYLYICKDVKSKKLYNEDGCFVGFKPRFKIGITNNLKVRFSYYKKENIDMELLFCISCKYKKAEIIEDTVLNCSFSPLYDRYITSEWFYDVNKITKVIEFINHLYSDNIKIIKDYEK